jgi:hypothetical protein
LPGRSGVSFGHFLVKQMLEEVKPSFHSKEENS